MVPVAYSDRAALSAHAHEVQILVAQLLDDADFRTAIGRATADRFRMLYRIGVVADGFRSLGVSVDLPERLGLE
jgi:hypothetical protein